MFVVRVVADSNTSTMQMFQPRLSIHVGGWSAGDTLLNDRLGKTSLESCWHQIHRRRLPLLR